MRYLETVLSSQLRDLALPGRLAAAGTILAEAGGKFQPEAVEILAAALKDIDHTGLAKLLEMHPDSSNAAYLAAIIFGNRQPARAAQAWRKFFTLRDDRDPAHLLAFARSLSEAGEYGEAAVQLQSALAQTPAYPFFARAEKLIQTVASSYDGYIRQARIAVLGTSTIAMHIPVLRALCFRDRIKAEFYQGLYGALEQEILDAASGLHRFNPNIALIAVNWRDLALAPLSSNEELAADAAVTRFEALWSSLRERFGCHVVQQAFDYPGEEAYGYIASAMRGGRSRTIAAINQAMLDRAPSYVSILDTPALQREAGQRTWEDPMLWHSFKQHPANSALPLLAEEQSAHIRAALGLSRKVLVTDLDNTLWGGVIGEDGLDGIRIGPGSAEGEAHEALQAYMLDLKSRGILLAVSSKNNPDEARLPFERHPQMKLRLDDFAAFEANWNDKAANIRRIAEKLSLGLDSFVFLDDNPLERAWVRSQLPQVAVVEPGGPSVFHFLRALHGGRYFFALSLSKEDLARAGQYRIEAARDSLRSACGSMEEFLAQLNMRASSAPVNQSNLPRVAQLINKTNQFNATTRRYTAAQVREIALDPAGWASAFELSDRMGSYGLIGVMLCKLAGESADAWEIDTWLMSCRTLGRQMEEFMFDRLAEAARARGIRRIVGVYRPTQKNGLMSGLFERFGFERISEAPEEIRFMLSVPERLEIKAIHIQNASAPETALVGGSLAQPGAGELPARDEGAARGHRSPAANNDSLFGPEERGQVARAAARDRDQLLGRQLTEQIKASLSPEEQSRNLKPRKSTQTDLFSGGGPEQGAIFNRPPKTESANQLTSSPASRTPFTNSSKGPTIA